DVAYYKAAIDVAAEYCAYLCRLYGWTAANICSHREAARAGYASNHGDPESWMRHFGDDMGKFRARVDALLSDLPGEYTIVTAGDAEAGASSNQPTVRMGSKGEAVRRLQNTLMVLGFALDHGADGNFGGETLEALEDFQRKYGLDVDGVCGPKTWVVIAAALEDTSSEEEGQEGEAAEPTAYTVTITGVNAATATYLLETYPSAQAMEMATNG
ncbi:MAG: N-acetylmuramoyl-L-alanine amidase, partial [Janthinobacterium sp.]